MTQPTTTVAPSRWPSRKVIAHTIVGLVVALAAGIVQASSTVHLPADVMAAAAVLVGAVAAYQTNEHP